MNEATDNANYQPRTRRSQTVLALLMCWGCAVSACDDDSGKKPAALRCAGGTLEADMEGSGWTGAGVATETGELRLSSDRSYMVSSTYGVPVPGPDGAPITERYGELFAAVQAQLEKQPGLLGFQLASSEACGSGRTLAVWETEEAMYDFVFSPAHTAAMAAVDEVLKPGYGVTHWQAKSEAQISFEVGAHQLALEASGD